jgi:hypothetical protein
VIDELDAALEVQAELGLLPEHDDERAADEGDHDEQDEE